MTYAELKSRAVKVTHLMFVYWPQFNREVTMDLEALNVRQHRRKYSYNNSVVAFVDEVGDLYAIPDIGVQKVLAAEGYAKEYFFVPFSNWEYPVEYRKKWLELWEEKNRH